MVLKGIYVRLAALALILPASACSSASDEDDHVAESSRTLLHPSGTFDEDSALADAVADVDDSSFEDIGDTSDCTQDCSGHDAGFEWAKEHDITDPADCGGNSESFIQGCEAYGEAIQSRLDDERSEFDER